MKKIVIIGSSGSGKSTLARKLAVILEIKVIHLDHHFWQTGWKEYSKEARIQIEHDLIDRKATWIIEGSYLSTSDHRLKAADTIIFLDIPFNLCLISAIKRHFEDQSVIERPDLPTGCKDRISLMSILKILLFPLRGRKVLLKKFAELRVGTANNPIIRLHSRKEVDEFLRLQAKERHMPYTPTNHKLASNVTQDQVHWQYYSVVMSILPLLVLLGHVLPLLLLQSSAPFLVTNQRNLSR